MTKELTTQQKEDLRLHELWLNHEEGGVRLDWSRKDLRGIDLQGANLRRADLHGANLEEANLQWANLRGANLEGANLRGANLEWADMEEANLTRANLEWANLQRAYLQGTNLRGADLQGAYLQGAEIDYRIQEGLLEQIAELVLKEPNTLNMGNWYTCSTTHCLAGWACHLNPVAKELEDTHGTQVAGLLTLGQEAHSHFFNDNKTALEWLKTKRVSANSALTE